MAEWLAHLTPNHMKVGSSRTEATWLTKNSPAWATGDNGVSVHSALNEYLAIDRHGNCKRMYTPRGVEQVTDVTGLLGVGIICKAF